MGLPTFETAGMRLYKRLTFVAAGPIEKVLPGLPARPQRRRRARLARGLAASLSNGETLGPCPIPAKRPTPSRASRAFAAPAAPADAMRSPTPSRAWAARSSTSRSPSATSDVVLIVDLPDNVAATAVALTVNAAGGAATKMTLLISAEEVDEAAQRSVEYRPPGG